MNAQDHILIVDDDREIRDLLSRFLSANGCRVSVARDEREMRKVLAEAAIDVIVLDVMMPGMDGFATLRWLKAAQPEIQVVMLSGRECAATTLQAARVHAPMNDPG
jgi:two-component system OmpR family response regulator